MKSLSTNINNGNKHNILKNEMRLSSSSSSHHQQQRSNKTRGHRIKPAEVNLKFLFQYNHQLISILKQLYRTDFITAMKLPDNESLDEDAYLLIRDPWKLDWEKGVQVPIKPAELNNAKFKIEPTAITNNSVNRALRHLNYKL